MAKMKEPEAVELDGVVKRLIETAGRLTAELRAGRDGGEVVALTRRMRGLARVADEWAAVAEREVK
jgi:hypothetical protein